ncbi:MAG: DUF3078 domain-containing protein [Sphingobacteriaceae bacterium]|nr:DUF3078 domain-containing protein [Sphingobacteriaceae bacterium]
MLKNILVVILFLQFANLKSQDSVKKDTTYWKKSGFFGLNLAQTSLSNWQGGGQENISFSALINYEANYKKAKVDWSNKFDGQYGIVRLNNSKFWQKNVDQVFAVTKFNLYAFKKYWFYSLMADLRSQFADGYKYSGDTLKTAISRWASPAFIQIALGIDFKPRDYFSISISPAAGKITLVTDQNFANNGDYGVTKAVLDTAGRVITPGKKARYEFGGRVTIRYKKDLNKIVNLDTYADFFDAYNNNKSQNIDIVWNSLLTIKITKYFTATLSTKFVYDNDIITKYDWDNDGKYDNKNDIFGPRAQWMSVYGIGFGYKF